VLDFQIDDECSYEYSYIFVANLLEGVGVIAALNTVDTLGRSVSQTLFFVVTAALLFTYGGLYVGSESTAALVMLFIAKITSAGAMCVLWIQTAEIYPTEVHTYTHMTTQIHLYLYRTLYIDCPIPSFCVKVTNPNLTTVLICTFIVLLRSCERRGIPRQPLWADSGHVSE
jgi:hypothetical protein